MSTAEIMRHRLLEPVLERGGLRFFAIVGNRCTIKTNRGDVFRYQFPADVIDGFMISASGNNGVIVGIVEQTRTFEWRAVRLAETVSMNPPRASLKNHHATRLGAALEIDQVAELFDRVVNRKSLARELWEGVWKWPP